MEKETGFMDLARARKLMAEMAAMAKTHGRCTVVPFFRGESLTHPQWDKFLEAMHEFDLGPIQMATNASLLTEDRARRLLEIGVDTLSFSMDTTDPETYKILRGSDYKKSLGNVLRFLEMRRENPEGCKTVQVSAVETAKNRHQLEDFIAFWRPRVDRIRIYPEHSADGNPGSLPGCKATASRTPCHKVIEDMVIYWNGDVALCNHDWTRRVTGQHIGNVMEQGIDAVWNSDAYRKIREAHECGNVAGIAPCENCAHWGTGPVGRVVTP